MEREQYTMNHIIKEKQDKALELFASLEPPSFSYGLGMSIDGSGLNIHQMMNEFELYPASKVQVSAETKIEQWNLQSAPPEIINLYFDALIPATETKLTALHYAFLHDALIIRIPKNTKIQNPIQLKSFLAHSSAEHLILIAEPYSHITIIETAESGPEAAYKSQMVQVFAHENAQVTWSTLHHLHSQTKALLTKRASVAHDATVTWIDILLGNAFTQFQLRSTLAQPGAQSTALNAFLAAENQQSDLNIEMFHEAPYTKSAQHTKGIATDYANTIVRGNIHIDAHASNSVGHQKTDALLIGEKARCNAVPILEVENNEVMCSHGATIGHLNMEQLFYALSRGLDEETDTQMILTGFLEPIIRHLPSDELKDNVTHLLIKKIKVGKEHEISN